MDADNLGRMFAPSIIRHETNTMDVVAAQAEAVIVSYFIANVLAFSHRRGKESSAAHGDVKEDGEDAEEGEKEAVVVEKAVDESMEERILDGK
jgi:hypothetical protein